MNGIRRFFIRVADWFSDFIIRHVVVNRKYWRELNTPLVGDGYSDEELRIEFMKGLMELEDDGDYDLLETYADMENEGNRKKIVRKALMRRGITDKHLTGRQWISLDDVVKFDADTELPHRSQQEGDEL